MAETNRLKKEVDPKCNLFCDGNDTSATVSLYLVNSQGDTVWPPKGSPVNIGQQECARKGATPEQPCTVNIHPTSTHLLKLQTSRSKSKDVHEEAGVLQVAKEDVTPKETRKLV